MQSPVITVFEDRRQKVQLSPHQISDLLALAPILGEGRLSLGYDGTLHVKHFVGFISKGKTRLQILPKIYENTVLADEEERRQSMQAMLTLLRVSGFNRVLMLPEQVSAAAESDLMEIFIALFADKVFHTYSRQMNREYIETVENSPFVKGSIEFGANLRENPIRRDRHIVRFQSFEHDNLINNIIKTVGTKLIRLTRLPENKKNLKTALVFLDDAREVRLSKDLFDSVRFNRLNMPFKPVFDMAKMFFYNLTPHSYQGDDTVCSFLIPLNELFEFYLFRLFEGLEDGLVATYQNTRAFAHSDAMDFRLTVRPDILLKRGKVPVFIADAKYKNPGWVNGKYTRISQADIYQVYAYAKVYGLDTAALIYPQFDNAAPPRVEITLHGCDGDVCLQVACVDIREADMGKGREALAQMLYASVR